MCEQEKKEPSTQTVELAYKSTTYLLVAEQTHIWVRMATTVAFAGIAVPIFNNCSRLSTQIFIAGGWAIVYMMLYHSLGRSFRLRDHFARLMRKREKQLGMSKKVGPLRSGKKKFPYTGTKIFTFRFLVIVLAFVPTFILVLKHVTMYWH